MPGIRSTLAAVAAGLTVSVLPAAVLPASGDPGHDHEHVVVIEHGRFSPAEVEVGVGETVEWRHDDGDDPQSVTADGGSFDSHPDCRASAPEECMRGGETFEHTFRRAGRYRYHSRTEGGPGGEGMSGVVVVTDEHDHDH